jgi:hypothetical protein
MWMDVAECLFNSMDTALIRVLLVTTLMAIRTVYPVLDRQYAIRYSKLICRYFEATTFELAYISTNTLTIKMLTFLSFKLPSQIEMTNQM